MVKGRLDLDKLQSLPPHLRERALQSIELLKQGKEDNPLWYYNHPILSDKPVHEKQMMFHGLPQYIRCFFGGNQSGKTTAGIADDLIQAYDWDAVPEHLHFVKKFDPPFYARLYTTDFKTLELTFIPKLRELVAPSQLRGGSWATAFSKGSMTLDFENGSKFQFVTYAQDVSQMGGATIHRVHFDEEPPLDHFEESKIRVMKLEGDLIFTMTPLMGMSWTYNDIWEDMVEFKNAEEVIEGCFYQDHRRGIIVVDMDDNPYLTEETKTRTLEGYPDEVIEARKKGRFIHFSGLIYHEFKDDVHVVPDVEFKDVIPNINNVVVGIDPGISVRHKCAVVWCLVTPGDDLFVFDELYLADLTIREVCERIHKVNNLWGVNPIYYVIDPKAQTRNQQTGRSDQTEFFDHAIHPILGQNDVITGINRIKERLKYNKLFVFDTCTNLKKEFKRYRWKDAPKSGEDGKPAPIKTDDHALDALRYVAMSRPYLPKRSEELLETPLQTAKRLAESRALGPKPVHEFGAGIYA